MAESQSSVSSYSTGILTFPTNASEEATFEESQASQVFRIVFFSLTTLASLLGNSIMLKAAGAFPSRKPLPYHLVTNLAAAEIINTLCFPFTFVYVYLQYWPFGEFACKVTIPLQVLSLFVVIYTLAAISVYRFVFIVFQFRITVSYCRLILFFSLLWLIALPVSMPLLVYQQIGLLDGGRNYCFPNFKGDNDAQKLRNSKTYDIVKFILNFGLPYLIMVVSYGAVAWKLKRHINHSKREAVKMNELGETTKQIQEEEDTNQQQDTEATEREERRKSSRAITDLENDLLKMIYAIIIVFAVSYLPYQVYFLFETLHGFDRYPEAKKYETIISQYCLLLTALSSALHPLCYGTMSKFYARSFSRLVLWQCKQG